MVLLINVITVLFRLLDWLIIARVILSWVRPNPSNKQWRHVISFVFQVTEPILAPIRRLLPTGNMGIDFSPIVAILALGIIRNFLLRFLSSMAY
ncbi:MAG: YggT family protein [Bacillota bacterium]